MPGIGENILNLSRLREVQDAMMSNLAEPNRLTLVASPVNPGALRMLTYVPPGLSLGAPLVVVLHGCTQNAAAYDHGAGWSTLADRHGFALLFPEQQRANNANLCFNWFQTGDVTRGQGEVESIRQMIAQMIHAHGLSPARVYITGLSAGGAMAAAMLATYPEAFAGAAIIAGLPYGSAHSMHEAIEAMHQVRHHSPKEWGDLVRAASPHDGPWPHVQIWHGDSDMTVRRGNFEELLKQWSDVHGVSTPPATEQLDGAIHSTWRGPTSSIVLESYLVPGLAHGIPLNTGVDDMDQSMGFAAPYMLEAGISSTWRIANSWGLLTQAARSRRSTPRPVAPQAPLARVGSVIENALRSVGLS